MTDTPGSRRSRPMSFPGTTVLALGVAFGSPAGAAEGHWGYSSYAVKPPQAQLDAVKAGPGRVLEQKVAGAFQPALSGTGTIDLSLKSDDADRRIFLTNLTFSFTTGVEMRTLSPGQKLRFNATATMGGNGLSKALPARGSGKMAVGNGDYFVALDTLIDQPASGAGMIQIPNGGPGASLLIYATSHIGSYGGLNGTLEIYYDWKDGPAPASLPPPAK